MVRPSQKFDVASLHKLLRLAKNLEEVMGKSRSRPVSRVMVRTSDEGTISFELKGGSLWHLFNITLTGREREYDLAGNFAAIQSLFSSLDGFSHDEIRRASQTIEIAADTHVPTGDIISSLKKLQETLNSIIEHVKEKKTRKESDDARKQHIIEACERMRIHWAGVVQKTDKKARLQKKQPAATT